MSRRRVTMLLENNPYPQDVRVRREAESLQRAGHDVTVVAPRGPGQQRREVVRGVAVRRFRLPVAGSGAGSLVAEYLIANIALHAAAVRALLSGAEVLHLHNPPDTLFPAGLLARALGRRVVFDHHDLFPELTAERIGSGAVTRAAALLERATFAVADRVLAANESHAEIARTRGGVDAAAVTVLRNGPMAAALEAPAGGRDGVLDDPHLVYVGSIADQDGVAQLAEVMRLLRDKHALPGARLTLVGDGDDAAAVMAAAERAGVRDRIELTGWVPLDDVPARIAAADVCVDPAPPSELNDRSTMIKVAEYMAAGKPVVAYDLRETHRTTGDAAELVTPGDAHEFAARVAALARDPTRRRDLGARARDRARDLTWEVSEQALLRVYDEL